MRFKNLSEHAKKSCRICLPRSRQSGCYVKLVAHITANLTSCVVRRHIQSWTTLCLSFKRVVAAELWKLLIETWLVNTKFTETWLVNTKFTVWMWGFVCERTSSEPGLNNLSTFYLINPCFDVVPSVNSKKNKLFWTLFGLNWSFKNYNFYSLDLHF